MDQEAFEKAVKRELKNVFGYYSSTTYYSYSPMFYRRKPISEIIFSRKINVLQEQWERLNEKLNQLKEESILETRSEVKICLNKLIDDMQAERDQVKEQLINLENQLAKVNINVRTILIGFIFVAVLCSLYFIPETKLIVAIVRVFELVIATGGIGIGVVFLYNGSVFLYKKLTEKKRLLKTLKNLDMGIYKESVGKNLNEIKKILKNYSIQEASKLLAKEDVRKRICPALKSATDDVFDISKGVTPVLVDCVVAGTISIPLNPVLFAAIAVVIARMGISALCAGFITK